mmetsp:Transcript_91501/g.245041  ORF Transcript_91501/g.245041 Transcript_91501/m.245041 type:complete len:266 (-) Transcript_91501:1020-1817(-)
MAASSFSSSFSSSAATLLNSALYASRLSLNSHSSDTDGPFVSSRYCRSKLRCRSTLSFFSAGSSESASWDRCLRISSSPMRCHRCSSKVFFGPLCAAFTMKHCSRSRSFGTEPPPAPASWRSSSSRSENFLLSFFRMGSTLCPASMLSGTASNLATFGGNAIASPVVLIMYGVRPVLSGALGFALRSSSNSTAGPSPENTAWCSAVHPLLSCASKLAFATTSPLIASRSPRPAARCSAVRPLQSRVATSVSTLAFFWNFSSINAL